MEIIYFLIPVSLLFLAGAIWLFFWAVKSNQFDDMDGPAHRVIQDDREDRRKLDDDRH